MQKVCGIDLEEFFPKRDKKKDEENGVDPKDYVFNCEMTFQFALAWFLKNKIHENIKIEFEKNVYGKVYEKDKKEEDNRRCDIVITYANQKQALLELKYVVEGLDDGTKVSNDSRDSFMKDLCRLKFDPLVRDIEEKYCIFITNMSAVFNPGPSENVFINFFNKKFGNIKHWDFTNWNLKNNKIRQNCQFKPHILIVNISDNQITDQEWEKLKKEYNKRLEGK